MPKAVFILKYLGGDSAMSINLFSCFLTSGLKGYINQAARRLLGEVSTDKYLPLFSVLKQHTPGRGKSLKTVINQEQ